MAAMDSDTVFGQCRCCLNNGNHKSFTAPYYRNGAIKLYKDVFLECFNLFLSTDPKVPDLICWSCVRLLNEALEFRTMVVQSEQHLLSGTNSTIQSEQQLLNGPNSTIQSGQQLLSVTIVEEDEKNLLNETKMVVESQQLLSETNGTMIVEEEAEIKPFSETTSNEQLNNETGSNSTILNTKMELGLHSEVDIKLEADEDLFGDHQYCRMDYEDHVDDYARLETVESEDTTMLHTLPNSKPVESEIERYTVNQVGSLKTYVKTKKDTTFFATPQTSKPAEKSLVSLSDLVVPIVEKKGKKKTSTLHQVARVECCLTDFLLKIRKSKIKLSNDNLKRIIAVGRSCPDLKMEFKDRIRYFRREYYEQYFWLTGSCQLNKLFCFPCLLQWPPTCDKWNYTGHDNLGNIYGSTKKHEKTEKHLRNVLLLMNPDRMLIEEMSSAVSLGEAEKIEYNRKVNRNRDLMKRFIDTVIHLAKQGLPLIGHNETDDSNRGNYVETLLFLRQFDALLDSHLEQSSAFKFSGLSGYVQNDLIHCIASVVRDAIKLEINQANFVAAIIEGVNECGQMATILRYATASGIEERFLGLFDICGNQTLLNVLKEYECKEKLASQSYSVMSEELNLESPITVPCSAHSLTSVLTRFFENKPPFNTFFGTIHSIVRFFVRFPKCSKLLKEIADRRKPGVSVTRWDFNLRIIKVIFNCRPDMVETFKTMLDSSNSQDWNREPVFLADSLLNKLQDMQFCFLLHVFADIFDQTNALDVIFQNKEFDFDNAMKTIDSFKDWLIEFANKFESIYGNVHEYCKAPTEQRVLNERDMKTLYKKTFDDTLANIQAQIKCRYQDLSDMPFLNLINKNRNDHDIVNNITALNSIYPGKFDKLALQNELRALEGAGYLNKLDAFGLYSYLLSSKSHEMFKETHRLCDLTLALPLTVKFPERSFSRTKRKRLYKYIANIGKDERSNDLALICVENDLLMKLKNRHEFYDNVLAYFVKINRQIVLEYM